LLKKGTAVKAIVITAPGGPEVLAVRGLPDPVPGPGEVLIRVRAFGLNHADAAGAGVTVLASTRRADRAGLLRGIGAATVLTDDGRLADEVAGRGLAVDGVLDVVGNTVLRDSLRVVRPRGRVCQVGFLGGLAPVDGFDPLADLPSGVQLSFYGSAFVLGTADFPLDAIPLQEMIAKAEAGTYQARPSRVYGFGELPEAHRIMEAGTAGGKMVATVD
jgi:NADPH:quinone reductase